MAVVLLASHPHAIDAIPHSPPKSHTGNERRMMPKENRRPGLPARLLLVLAVFLAFLAAAAAAPATDEHMVQEDRWGPIATPVPATAVERFEAAVVGYASLRGEVVAPLEEVRAAVYVRVG